MNRMVGIVIFVYIAKLGIIFYTRKFRSQDLFNHRCETVISKMTVSEKVLGVIADDGLFYSTGTTSAPPALKRSSSDSCLKPQKLLPLPRRN